MTLNFIPENKKEVVLEHIDRLEISYPKQFDKGESIVLSFGIEGESKTHVAFLNENDVVQVMDF